MRKHKLAVFIGSFQPYNKGHHETISTALELADNVLVLLGSSNGPRTHRNPFSFYERVHMILSSFDQPRRSRIITKPLIDHLYNEEKWIEGVQNAVEEVKKGLETKSITLTDEEITLVGDMCNYSFPQWSFEKCENVENISSDDIREAFFGKGIVYGKDVTVPTIKFLMKYMDTDEYQLLKEEYEYVRSFRNNWSHAPQPPTFVTVEGVVVQSGHVLLVDRKLFPGKGLLALPEGHVGQTERIEDCMIRILKEETGIKVPDYVLRGNIRQRRVYDDPFRSSRGRTLAHAHLIHLPHEFSLPENDEEKSKWIPLSSVKRNIMFEDHYDIVENLTSLI